MACTLQPFRSQARVRFWLTLGLKAFLDSLASAILTGALGNDVWCKSAAAPPANPASFAVRLRVACGLVWWMNAVVREEENMQQTEDINTHA